MLARAVGRLPAAFAGTECRINVLRQAGGLAPTCEYRPSASTSTLGSTCQSVRYASSSSSTRWKSRQSRDTFARSAKVAGLKSRAAYKLLEIDAKYHLFKRGDTVVDLGYAPGSWSQVAVNRTSPGGRVVGIDVIPVQPPRGVSTLQGDFLSQQIREEVRAFVRDLENGRVRTHQSLARHDEDDTDEGAGATEEQLEREGKGYVELEKAMEERDEHGTSESRAEEPSNTDGLSQKQLDAAEGRVVNVVLSDMSAPWPLTTSTWIKSVSNPYIRMMNTSGIAFKDHAGSMDLCLAALDFCYETLVTGGHFLCKFYQGAEDHALELALKRLFEKVHRIKPDSSRKESKEAYFLAIGRRAGVERGAVLGGG